MMSVASKLMPTGTRVPGTYEPSLTDLRMRILEALDAVALPGNAAGALN